MSSFALTLADFKNNDFNPTQYLDHGVGGGVEILPAATLDINSFFNIEANATNLGDFF